MKRKRKEKEMSQLELALDTGVPLAYICRLETQRVMHPSFMHIIKIVKAFDSSIVELLEEK